MSSETPDTKPEETAPKKYDADDHPAADMFLRQIVSMANQWGIEQGITLAVGGAIITGQIIGGKRYFEEITKGLMGGTVTVGETVTGTEDGKSLQEAIATMYKAFASIYDRQPNEPEGFVLPPPSFIHLRNACWIDASGKRTPTNGALWRGRLTAVDGFTLGQMLPS